jgi:hypothetical protein
MLAFSLIPMFDRMDHPSVPTTFLGAWGHSIPLPLPAIPYRHREAEVGSPSKSGTAPSTIVLLLTESSAPMISDYR